MSQVAFNNDDATMSRQYIDDHHIVDRYVRGQLPDAMVSAFERTYLEDPELQDQVELAEAMQAQMKLAAPRLEATAKGSKKYGWWQRPQLLAALVAAVFAIPLAYTSLSLLDARARLKAPANVLATLSLGTVRGDGPDRFLLPANEPVVLRVDVGLQASGEYTVAIESPSGSVRRLRGARVDPQGAVSVFLQGLPVGTHKLLLTTTAVGDQFSYELEAVD